MFGTIITQAMLAVTTVVVIYAWWKGGPAERAGASWMALLSVAITAFTGLTGGDYGGVPIMIADGLMATIFLVLAVRYASLWLATAMLLQGGAFSIHASALLGLLPDSRHDLWYFYAGMNLLNFLVLVAIAWGTTSFWLRSRKAA